MDQMQAEIAALQPPVDVAILGIDLPGLEAFNASYCQGLSVPWLQDTTAQNVWVNWHAQWRDVYIVDKQNHLNEVYNLFDHDLSQPANYATLKNALIESARLP
jgi:hypothetical protein